ncbi:hypothetical protein Q766_02985 [Flavobacterium subsaxonicum WB 4.1-42 = DSM 21790]|uniref:Uncharacterized protein n=2 Tax=Flavobacterium TaxID=237 RepID=A0A0A2MRW7_9FLAO|nr:hypothetical protein Q766_02985 [Flavobacterium subsaxonicum WB 4.1-42 = DSM 21790]
MKNINLHTIIHATTAPCITISMNTPLCQADDTKLKVELESLLDQAKYLVLEKFNKMPLNAILEKINTLYQDIDLNSTSKSITIYLSENIKSVVKSIWPVAHNTVQVSDKFDLRPLIPIITNFKEYHILVLSRQGVKLLYARNDQVINEVKDKTFPVLEGAAYFAPGFQPLDESSQHHLDEFLNNLDKALIELYNSTGLHYVIISTATNYDRFIKAARFKSIYCAYVPLSGDHTHHTLAASAWNALLLLQKQKKESRIELMKGLIKNGRAITAKREILNAARNGKGDLLVINKDAAFNGDEEGACCEMVWNVINKKGDVILADQNEMQSIGNMALKLKY